MLSSTFSHTTISIYGINGQCYRVLTDKEIADNDELWLFNFLSICKCLITYWDVYIQFVKKKTPRITEPDANRL